MRATLAAAAPGWLAAVIDASWQQVYGQRAGNLRLPEAQAAREQAIGAWLRPIPVRGRPTPASVQIKALETQIAGQLAGRIAEALASPAPATEPAPWSSLTDRRRKTARLDGDDCS